MFERLVDKFINADDILGKGDELSGVMEMLIEDGSITEKRAYEIKQQLTEEYNEGKVSKKALPKRLSFLKNEIDFSGEVGVLKQTLSGDYSVCPYCLQIVDENSEFCHVCGYDLIHEEELNMDGVNIVDSREELDLSSIVEVFNRLSAKYGVEGSEDIPPLNEQVNLENMGGIYKIHSFNDENSNINNPDIDLFSILIKLHDGYSFDDAFDEVLINSGLSNQELFDLAIKNNFINKNGEILDAGYEFVISNDWMYFYIYYLESFNFDDFNRFYAENDYELETAGIEFLNEHVKIAIKNRDYYRLVDSYQAKGHIYDHIRKFTKSLRYELKVFILNLNPLYLNDNELMLHIPLDEFNVDVLCNFNKVYSQAQIKKWFNKEWNKIDFEKIRINRKKSWKILTDLLKGADIEEYCEKLEERYF